MKGQELPTGMIVFAGQLILLLLFAVWITGVGTAILDYFTTADARIVQAVLAGYLAAAEISDGFEATIRLPERDYTLSITETELSVKTEGSGVTFSLSGTEVSLKTRTSAPLVRYPVNDLKTGRLTVSGSVTVRKSGREISVVR